MGKEPLTQIQGSTTSTIENKPKEEHPETHINQTDQNKRHRENSESS